MRYAFVIAIAGLAARLSEPIEHASTTHMTADVVVAPFTVEKDSAGMLRTAADSCLERLVRALTAKGIAVARQPQLTEKSLALAKPALWAVLGRVTGSKAGLLDGELRLMEVATSEEMRSYFNSDMNPDALATFGEAAAVRIAAFIQERKRARPPDN